MKKYILLTLLSVSAHIFAQIGVNNTTPGATLDVVAKTPAGTASTIDGLLVPRVDRQRAQNMTGIATSTIIYINLINGTQTGNAVNVDAVGFYFYNGTAWVKIATGSILNIYNSNGTLNSTRDVALGGNNLGFTGAGNVGIGTAAPTAKLEVASGTTGTSGLKFTNINNTTATTPNAAALGVDASGNVVIQNVAPLTSTFKSFSIDANSAANSTVTIGTLQFRYPTTTCTNSTTYVQIRSTSGANNIGISHAMYTTAQNASTLVNTVPITLTPTFADITAVPLNCVQDGHAQFNFFSYTDRTFYRVNVNIADGDSLGFGALGYIFVELQK
ncbi:hypothetical protein SAMN05421664_1746 [Chryseobacterium soldanellicola]|uniref:Uncharacterized protein n=1 Tax=Chryseobacterium soldanellicola TaxID=311333 RepID=A0A1H1B707_9FLAO|nr:hypothetical protein [Chryseobacterium soldanellicola]SDQ47735.1 hypothetical protein SAMN05421664_1746 [Chryseobacterium soldanellicola]